MKKIAIFLLAIIFLLPLGAKEVFYQSIINASYLSDFAFGAVPLSLWGEIGVTGMELIPNMKTKIHLVTKAGITERVLRQDPVSGTVLDNQSHRYSVAFSDEELVFRQELMKNPTTGALAMSGFFGIRMRWEQAFATIKDIRDERYGGIFAPDYGLFPVGGDIFLKGTPELSGDKYFLAASFHFGFAYDDVFDSWFGHNEYGVSADLELAPSWFFNDMWFIDEVFTEAGKIDIKGYWNVKFADAKTSSGRHRFSLELLNSINSSIVYGSSVPRYLLERSFMGSYVVTRNFFTTIRSELVYDGPELFLEGTYPQIYIYNENAINSGHILNAVDTKSNSFEFYGGVGVGGKIYIMKIFNFFAELKYVYTENKFSSRSLDYSMGMFVNILAAL